MFIYFSTFCWLSHCHRANHFSSFAVKWIRNVGQAVCLFGINRLLSRILSCLTCTCSNPAATAFFSVALWFFFSSSNSSTCVCLAVHAGFCFVGTLCFCLLFLEMKLVNWTDIVCVFFVVFNSSFSSCVFLIFFLNMFFFYLWQKRCFFLCCLYFQPGKSNIPSEQYIACPFLTGEPLRDLWLTDLPVNSWIQPHVKAAVSFLDFFSEITLQVHNSVVLHIFFPHIQIFSFHCTVCPKSTQFTLGSASNTSVMRPYFGCQQDCHSYCVPDEGANHIFLATISSPFSSCCDCLIKQLGLCDANTMLSVRYYKQHIIYRTKE